MTAAMGQLRALAHVTDAAGVPLLSRTRALSTVSGGSWAGVPWVYLSGATSDEDFLGGFVRDPARLVPTATPGHAPAETLDQLAPSNIGGRCATSFTPVDLAIHALLLRILHRTPGAMLWQALMARQFLEPYGLSHPDRRQLPTSLFSFDAATLARDVTGPNPYLATVTAHLYADVDSARARRPFLVCNTSMFVTSPGFKEALLAPVQVTPFFTGIVGRPDGVDANGRAPGGGGIPSFSFDSRLAGLGGGDTARVQQDRPWSLTDALGASSASLAEPLKNQLERWLEEPALRQQQLRERLPALVEMHRPGLVAEEVERLEALLLFSEGCTLEREIQGILDELIPAYFYWPVLDAAPDPFARATNFADGGALDNTGIPALLSYADVDAMVSFLNSGTRLARVAHGIQDQGSAVEQSTRIEIDGMVPSLFGYQPYDPSRGYRPYVGDPEPCYPGNAHNQVFEPGSFADLLQGLWAASGGESRRHPPLFEQTLAVLPNEWHGVAGGREVRVLWVYLGRVADWYDALRPEVRALLGPFDQPDSFAAFPHYSTGRTELSATEINLMAHLTAWCIGSEADRFRSLYAAR
jgi:hypothetical protein